MEQLPDHKYYGSPCKRGHHTASGHSIRYKASKQCVECDAAYQKAKNSTDEHKARQRAYHRRMRLEDPERLKRYYQARLAKGSEPWQKSQKERNVERRNSPENKEPSTASDSGNQ